MAVKGDHEFCLKNFIALTLLSVGTLALHSAWRAIGDQALLEQHLQTGDTYS